ncbi:hypothetical protein Pmani_034018 [Petrolisthes manimaculis]|uniref:Ig-like domain-containing protein n=1 Tax=Petrolisthes manimaculis TaxID=1843537 RepID=A0AAE1TS41_9EUCA|nr:hypothetical protein Pmani_034018 [Petrolisthes manimaculis]
MSLSSDAPECAGDVKERTQGAARGSTAAVRCRVEAHPSKKLTWTWIRKKVDGTEEKLPQENVRSDGLTSSVLVTPYTPEDYGRFLCLASNSVGRQEAACVVNLVPAGPPDTPTNCSVTPVEPNATERNKAALRIICLAGFDGGLPQLFSLETWQDGVLAANMTNSTPQWLVEGLRAGVGVTLRVAAHNTRGRSDAIRFEVHTASAQQHAAPGSKWGFLGVPPLLGAIVGVGGVLIIILVTGVIVVKYNRRPQPAAHVHTLIMTPTRPPDPDTYDPDVVSSLRCHTNDNLDVLPQKTTTTTTTMSTEGKTAQVQQGQGQGQGQGQTQGQKLEGKQRNNNGHHKHTSFSRRFCLHRQDSPFPDSDCVDSDDSDSDSTFIDLTAAGRAASILPPVGRHCHSLPRPGKRGDIHVAAASLDLQLRACQTSQIVATPDGMIHRLPCMYRNPRRPFPSSSEELRHLTSSVEELHPLIFSRDIRNLLSSADMRHLSFSGTELRMMPPVGTWPPLVSSGELRLPLSTSGTLQSITTEEFRLMPSSSGSSPWDSQTPPTITTLSSEHHHQVQPALPDSSSASPMIPSSLAAAHPPTSSVVPSTISQAQVKQVQVQTSQHLQSHPAFVEMHPPRVDPQMQPYPSQPHQTSNISQHHQPIPHISSQTHPCYPDTQTHHIPICSEPQQQQQPWHVCTTNQKAPPSLSQPSEPHVSLRELQPPPPRPSGELEPLLSVIELQPPPSFREPVGDTCPHKPNEMSSTTFAPDNIQMVPSSVSLGVNSNEHRVRFSSERGYMPTHGAAPDAMKDEKSQLSKRNVFGLTVEIPRPQTTQAGKVPMMTAHCDTPTDRSIEGNLRISSPGNTTHSLRKEFKKKGKQVTFSDEETLNKPVVARVPAKSSEVNKSEKRCGQLFTSIDLSPSGRSKGDQGSSTFTPSPQKGVVARSPQKHTTEHHQECLRRGGSLDQGGFSGEVHASCPLRGSSQSSPVT